MSLFWFSIIAAPWMLLGQISSFIAGGDLTGRLRRRKHDATGAGGNHRDNQIVFADWRRPW